MEERKIEDFDAMKVLRALKNIKEWHEGLADAAYMLEILTRSKQISTKIKNDNDKLEKQIARNEEILRELQGRAQARELAEVTEKKELQEKVASFNDAIARASDIAKEEITKIRKSCEKKVTEINTDANNAITSYKAKADAESELADTAREERIKMESMLAEVKKRITNA